ncbi:MAG: hypothetical protein LKI93_03810 [Bifidobacteriaceae bacterium]|jgi:cell division protein FtsB|nr:hypothetical protein [Bifidobacteriaceae bacterium]MCI1914403.1 hypothetical protein [Bifidobacteriaceae bacterium]MCI1935855.1 hypothetical protein [Bifidobacteriaceae bacterium]
MSINLKATADDLLYLVSERENWPLLDQVRAHPAAWPELIEWIDRAQSNPDTAGAPPLPPEPKKSTLFSRFHHATAIVEEPPQPDSAEPIPVTVAEPEEGIEVLSQTLRQESETPQRPHAFHLPRLSRKTLIVILASILVLTALVGAGFHLQQAHEQQRISQEAAQRAADNAALSKATTTAKALIDDVQKSPVKDDSDVTPGVGTLQKALEEKRPAHIHADGVTTATEKLEKAYSSAVKKLIAATSSGMDSAIEAADKLKNAPASKARTKMFKLTDTWRGKEITSKNVTTADAERQALVSVTKTVMAEKKKAAASKKKTPAKRQSSVSPKSTYVPRQRSSNSGSSSGTGSNTAAPKSTTPRKNSGGSGSSKSWTVPAPEQQGSLPNHL